MFKYLISAVPLLIFVECDGQSWHTRELIFLRHLYDEQGKHFGVLTMITATLRQNVWKNKKDFIFFSVLVEQYL